MTAAAPTLTERLDLRPTDPAADLDALAPVYADPDGWWYEPESRHRDAATTRGWLARSAQRWSTDGLSYWTVRLRETEEIIGTGGAQRHRSGAWNLSYRIAGVHQGRGYATELGRAARDAAADVDPDVPVIAWVLARNEPSRRVAAAIGLTDRGERRDASDGRVRIAYADRSLDDAIYPPA